MAEQKQRPPILFITNQQQEDTKLIRLVRENTFDVSFVEKYRAVFIDQKCNFITIKSKSIRNI